LASLRDGAPDPPVQSHPVRQFLPQESKRKILSSTCEGLSAKVHVKGKIEKGQSQECGRANS
jgi:hypothetical protein